MAETTREALETGLDHIVRMGGWRAPDRLPDTFEVQLEDDADYPYFILAGIDYDDDANVMVSVEGPDPHTAGVSVWATPPDTADDAWLTDVILRAIHYQRTGWPQHEAAYGIHRAMQF